MAEFYYCFSELQAQNIFASTFSGECIHLIDAKIWHHQKVYLPVPQTGQLCTFERFVSNLYVQQLSHEKVVTYMQWLY